mgnify:CR=1 FL=1
MVTLQRKKKRFILVDRIVDFHVAHTADEAAAGAYDLIVLARGYLEEEVTDQGSPAYEVIDVIEKSVGDEVQLMVV